MTLQTIITLTVFGLLILIIIAKMIRIVPQSKAFVVERIRGIQSYL